jgi:membrane dipeptidase
VLGRLTANGGVVMITFVPAFVSAASAAWEAAPADARGPRPDVTIAEVADHVEHARDVAGVEHIGLGGDYDGTEWFPPAFADVSSYPRLADELRRRGWSSADLHALAGGNVLRVLAATDARVLAA